MSIAGKLFKSTLIFHKLALKPMHRDIFFVDTRNLRLEKYEMRQAVLELMSREILRYKVEGETAELGVYKGDFAKRINHFFPGKKLYLFDTFEGFDKRDKEADKKKDFSKADEDFSNTSVELVLSKMEHRENCIIRKGWFPDTAEGINEKFCFVSIDADLYQPTIAGLEFFYPRLSHGGVIMIHDFNAKMYSGVREAVKEFCEKNTLGYICLPDNWGSCAITK